jgi:hypothetical protein
MSEGGLIDPALMEIFHALSGALLGLIPNHFESAYCLIEQAPQQLPGRLRYRVGSKEHPGEETARPSPELHQAAYRLFRHWTRDGGLFPPVEVRVWQEPQGVWRAAVNRREPPGAGGVPPADATAQEQFWERAVRAREEFFTAHFGPLPGEIQKLVNLMGLWPGGGLYQFEAPRLHGLGVCTTWGLSNPDMPTPVRLAHSEWTQGADGPSFSGQLGPREPVWIPEERAGYGYEVLVLTPALASWPLLTLSWLAQMEILNDVDLLGRVEDAQGVTLEDVKIGDGSQKADFLIEPASDPLPGQFRLPNGIARLLIATRITRDEMQFALAHGRPALLELLRESGVGQISVPDRASVVR